MYREIVVVPFPHPGHIFPATELCNQLANRDYKVTLFIPSTSSPSSLSLHPLIRIEEFSIPDPIRFQPPILDNALLDLLNRCFNGRDSSPLPICAIVDDMMSWLIETFLELKIPAVSLFTSSASSAAVEHATMKISQEDLSPGRILTIPGLPDNMGLLTVPGPKRRAPPFGPGDHHHDGPHTRNGGPRRGLMASDGAVALLFNTCDNLERPFLDYVAKEMGKPVWGVGPLLPSQFWAAAGTPVRDGEVRSRRESDVSEREVLDWLDSKPRGSMIYVSFGTLVNPTDAELAELEEGLEESNQPFIWVIQPGAKRHDPAGNPIRTDSESGGVYFPEGLARRVGERGLVIRGWAPQLMILNHPSTGVFVCHCGWNSTVEALVCGVPMLTWPVRGDQMHNAKLVTSMLRVGCPIRGGEGEAVRKNDVLKGIERVMGDVEMSKRAASVRSIFAGGFPGSSSSSLDCFLDFVSSNFQRK